MAGAELSTGARKNTEVRYGAGSCSSERGPEGVVEKGCQRMMRRWREEAAQRTNQKGLPPWIRTELLGWVFSISPIYDEVVRRRSWRDSRPTVARQFRSSGTKARRMSSKTGLMPMLSCFSTLSIGASATCRSSLTCAMGTTRRGPSQTTSPKVLRRSLLAAARPGRSTSSEAGRCRPTD